MIKKGIIHYVRSNVPFTATACNLWISRGYSDKRTANAWRRVTCHWCLEVLAGRRRRTPDHVRRRGARRPEERNTMTLEEFTAKVKAFDSRTHVNKLVRDHDPGPAAHRANGCGKFEIWVKTLRSPDDPPTRWLSDWRWGGGPTLDDAIADALESLAYYAACKST